MLNERSILQTFNTWEKTIIYPLSSMTTKCQFTYEIWKFLDKPLGLRATPPKLRITPEGHRVTPGGLRVTPEAHRVTLTRLRVTPEGYRVTPGALTDTLEDFSSHLKDIPSHLSYIASHLAVFATHWRTYRHTQKDIVSHLEVFATHLEDFSSQLKDIASYPVENHRRINNAMKFIRFCLQHLYHGSVHWNGLLDSLNYLTIICLC